MASGRAETRTDIPTIAHDDGACDRLAAALAACTRACLQALLERHPHPAIDIVVDFPEDHREPARIELAPRPVDVDLQARIERAILRCPVSRRLRRAPQLFWHDQH